MIDIQGLSHSYPVRATRQGSGDDGRANRLEFALSDVDLQIARGERVVLLGSSGAGKSTLLRCTNSSIRPTKGKIFIDGTEITSLPTGEVQQIRRRIGVISQHFNLVEGASALKNALLGRLGYVATVRSVLGRFPEEDYAIATDCLDRVGLGDFAHKRVSDMSGGQKQRVAVARALAQRPTIILADEPVSNLDPRLMKETMDLIQEVCLEDDITLVASLHFLEMAKTYATRLVGIRSGEIVYNDAPQEFTDRDVMDIYGETDEWVLYGRTGF